VIENETNIKHNLTVTLRKHMDLLSWERLQKSKRGEKIRIWIEFI